jgi:flagellar hook assembly protein FlgD
MVTFNLSQDAKVNVIIRSQTGTLVRTLVQNLAATAGVNSVAWDRTDNAGHRVPAGLYLCEVIAVDESTNRQVRGNGLISLTTYQVK